MLIDGPITQGRVHSAQEQANVQVEQVDIGYRDDDVSTQHSACVEHAIKGFCESNIGCLERVAGAHSLLELRCTAI